MSLQNIDDVLDNFYQNTILQRKNLCKIQLFCIIPFSHDNYCVSRQRIYFITYQSKILSWNNDNNSKFRKIND